MLHTLLNFYEQEVFSFYHLLTDENLWGLNEILDLASHLYILDCQESIALLTKEEFSIINYAYFIKNSLAPIIPALRR
jgi:hypothetical protein